MTQQRFSVSEAAKRIRAGEQPGAALGMSPAQVQAFAALGFTVYQQGRLQDAEVMFRGVVALDNKNYLGYAGLGAIAMATNPPDLDTAYANLSKAVELNPNDATVQANMGEVLLKQGKLEEAKGHLEKAFQLDPGHNDPGANRARAIIVGLDMIIKEVQKRAEPVQRAKAS
jgi:tetratricopeptide (TPR) repeat protein